MKLPLAHLHALVHLLRQPHPHLEANGLAARLWGRPGNREVPLPERIADDPSHPEQSTIKLISRLIKEARELGHVPPPSPQAIIEEARELTGWQGAVEEASGWVGEVMREAAMVAEAVRQNPAAARYLISSSSRPATAIADDLERALAAYEAMVEPEPEAERAEAVVKSQPEGADADPAPAKKQFMTPAEAASTIGVKPEKVRGWILAGKLWAIDVSSSGSRRPRWRIGREVWEQFLTEEGERKGGRGAAPGSRRRRKPKGHGLDIKRIV